MQTRRQLLRSVTLAAAGIGTGVALGGSAKGAPVSFGGLAYAGGPRAPGDGAAQAEVVRAVTSFGTDLYRRLAGGTGNLACSPYSIAAALAMTRAGARGTTATEMDAVLHTSPAGRLDSGFGGLDAHLATRSGRRQRPDGTSTDVVLALANSLWGQGSERWEPEFLGALARGYGAGMHTVDYVRETEAARRAINGWTDRQTFGRIPELVPVGVLDRATRLVLVNAVYLKAPWRDPFHSDDPGPFTRPDGSRVSVPMMRQYELETGYLAGPGWQAVRLPYLGDELAMTLVVPDPGRLAAIERDPSGPVRAALRPDLPTEVVDLRLPRWTFRVRFELSEVLAALGMPTAFSDAADFSGMTRTEALAISAVLHEVFVAVDEAGTEAAAATAVAMTATAGRAGTPITLTVDRPYLFLVHDVATGTPLFLGRVGDPTAR